MLIWFSFGRFGQLFIAGIVQCCVQVTHSPTHRHADALVRNTQSSLPTARFVCVSVAGLFGNYGNSYITVCRQSEMCMCIHNTETLVGQKK